MRAASKSVFAVADLFTRRLQGPRILIYHQVIDNPTVQMSVTPDIFARQVAWLQGEGKIMGLDAALGTRSSTDTFVLTFDDGYDGVYRHAFPFLRDRGIPFVLYLTSGLVGGASRQGASGLDPLTWDQVGEMVDSGLTTVGAHTHTHPDLRTISADQIEEELDTSNRIIEQRTGVKPAHFAYPKGYWVEDAEQVITSRYETAVLGAGADINEESDRYRLSRLPVQRADGLFFFKRRIAHGLKMEEWVRTRIKGYRNPGGEVGRIGGSRA